MKRCVAKATVLLKMPEVRGMIMTSRLTTMGGTLTAPSCRKKSHPFFLKQR